MEPSHVLKAIGLKDEMLRGGIRLTLGRETTAEEVEQTVIKMSEIVEDLRRMSR